MSIATSSTGAGVFTDRSRADHLHVAPLNVQTSYDGSNVVFHLLSSCDWSHRVTRPIQGLFQCLSTLGNSNWGRRFLLRKNPLYRSFSQADWKDIADAVRAHDHVHRYSKYMAFVFEKR